jgi:hypothetical protein
MNSDRRVDKRILIGESKGFRVRVGCDLPVANAHNSLDSGVERALNDGVSVDIELGSFYVCV